MHGPLAGQYTNNVPIRGRGVKTWSAENHSSKLKQLSVQSKALVVVELEEENQTSRRITQDPPAGQLSFLLRAGKNTLPTPLNLRQWQLKVDSSYIPSVVANNPLSTTAFPTAQRFYSREDTHGDTTVSSRH